MAGKQPLSTFIRIQMWSALEHEEVRVAISPFGGQVGHLQAGALAQPRPGRAFKK